MRKPTYYERFATGRWPRGNFPYGFASSNMDVAPEEMRVVRMVFEQLDAGFTTGQIADGLTVHGYKTRRGFMWTRFNLRSIVQNRLVYEGTHMLDPDTGELAPCPKQRVNALALDAEAT